MKKTISLILAFMFTIGIVSATDSQVVKEKEKLEVTQALPHSSLKVEVKEAYKVDDAEYTGFVATKSSFGSGSWYSVVSLVAMFSLIGYLFNKLLKSFSFRKLAFSILAITAFALFVNGNTEAGVLLATVPPVLTEDEKKKQDALIENILGQVKGVITDSQKENAKKEDVDKKVNEINKAIKDLTEESIKTLKDKVDELAKTNETLQKDFKASQDALKLQGEELKKLSDAGINRQMTPEERKVFRQELKNALLEKKDGFMKEVNDDYGKRLSMKEYFEGGHKVSPKFTIKVAVDMLESNIVQANVGTIRLTELDPMRVGIPLTIYPHVMDVFKVKSITKPNMALLVVYSYEDGAGTKTEGSASAKSSFLFKTVSFPAFYIATYFTLSDETLDDLEEALDEISATAPDKILDEIDDQVLGSAGDDSSALAGILTASKHTDFSNPFTSVIEDAYIVDVIAAAKLQCENNNYRPNLVYMNPSDVVLLAAKKNTFEDSQTDRRVAYDVIGNPVAVCGLRVIQSTSISQNELIVIDNRQPWIGRRKDMTMEIGYNGTDLTEGQKTVVLKTRIAFGVRDKAGVIYVDDIATAITALQST